MNDFITEEVYFSGPLVKEKIEVPIPSKLKVTNGFWALCIDSLVFKLSPPQVAKSVGVKTSFCTSYPKDNDSGLEKFTENVLHVFILTPETRQAYQFGRTWNSINSASASSISITFFQIDDSLPNDPATAEEIRAHVSGVLNFKKIR